jgi:hypothetical protein
MRRLLMNRAHGMRLVGAAAIAASIVVLVPPAALAAAPSGAALAPANGVVLTASQSPTFRVSCPDCADDVDVSVARSPQDLHSGNVLADDYLAQGADPTIYEGKVTWWDDSNEWGPGTYYWWATDSSGDAETPIQSFTIAPLSQLRPYGAHQTTVPYSRLYAFSVKCGALPCRIKLEEKAFAKGRHRPGLDRTGGPIVTMRSQPRQDQIYAVWFTASDINQRLLERTIDRYESVSFQIAGTVTDALGRSTSATRTVTIRPAPLPIFISGSGQYAGRKPKDLYFSGDGGNIVTGIRWSQWTASRAVGAGTSNILGCVPNCAQGSARPVKTTVVLSGPVRGHFTFVSERRNGQTYTAHYGRPGWPWDAS